MGAVVRKMLVFTVFFAVALYGGWSYAQNPAGGNILPNGGFEKPGAGGLPLDWRVMPNFASHGSAAMDGKFVHSGRFSLKLSPNWRDNSDGFGVFLPLNPQEVEGREVTISGYARLEGMGKNPAGLLFKTDKANWLIFLQAVQNRFFFFSRTFQVSKSIPEASLCFMVGGKTGSAWIDDLSVTVASAQAGKPGTLRPGKDIYVNKINTPGWQDSPFITPDGRTLYFAYMPYTHKDFMNVFLGRVPGRDVRIKGPVRPGETGMLDFETFESMKNVNGRWSAPVKVRVAGDYPFFAAKTSFDGRELYYTMSDYPGGYGAEDIYVSRRLGDGQWGKPENLGPDINSGANEDTPCISADGKTLYFARNTHGDALGWEIYVSHRVNGRWTMAEKMPRPVNQWWPGRTANLQPFITADGRELYFTRIQQLYRSVKRRDGTWGEPGEVFPGLPVSGHASVTADGRFLYFITVKDKESLERENWTIWYAERRPDGNWGAPKPVD